MKEGKLLKSKPEELDVKKGRLHHVKHPSVLMLIALVVATIAIVSLIYWKVTSSRIYVEKSEISAPVISLGPATAGVIDKIFVKEGDFVRKNMIVAIVGDYQIQTKTDGIVIAVENTPGQLVSSQDAVVKMIDPRELRVVGRVEEDKGLRDIHPGQHVIFTVDAFDGKEYQGIVDSISPSARQSDIVFTISDKREQREFDVKVKYDIDAYPELKNRMSAKMWIYK